MIESETKYLTKTFRRTAQIDGVGLDQAGIELVLMDELAEAVADLGAAAIPIRRLGRNLLRLPAGWSWLGKRADLLDRADADAVCFAQGPVDRPGLRHPHLGAVDQGRDIGGTSIAVADKRFGWRFTNGSSKYPPPFRRL